MRLEEAIDTKGYLTGEIAKFNGRGHYTYIVHNYAYNVKKCIESESEIKHIDTSKHEKMVQFGMEEIVPLCDEILKYRCFQESDLWNLCNYVTGHNDANYYDFIKLVKMVNAWFDVNDEKAPNRIAWGWEKCKEKDNPQAYLYGCIRNYLTRNGSFDKNEFNKIWFGRF